MYSYSHQSNSGWMGRYNLPQDALIAGRAAYGSDARIFVGKWQQAMYSDMFIGADTLLFYMKEDATGRVGDEHVEALDNLPPSEITKLNQFLVDAISEWESELPEDQQFTGQHIEQVVGYSEDAQVRRGHFE